MIFIILGVAIALLCYRMGILIGQRIEQERMDYIRQEMGLDSSEDEWSKLFNGDDT